MPLLTPPPVSPVRSSPRPADAYEFSFARHEESVYSTEYKQPRLQDVSGLLQWHERSQTSTLDGVYRRMEEQYRDVENDSAASSPSSRRPAAGQGPRARHASPRGVVPPNTPVRARHASPRAPPGTPGSASSVNDVLASALQALQRSRAAVEEANASSDSVDGGDLGRSFEKAADYQERRMRERAEEAAVAASSSMDPVLPDTSSLNDSLVELAEDLQLLRTISERSPSVGRRNVLLHGTRDSYREDSYMEHGMPRADQARPVRYDYDDGFQQARGRLDDLRGWTSAYRR